MCVIHLFGCWCCVFGFILYSLKLQAHMILPGNQSLGFFLIHLFRLTWSKFHSFWCALITTNSIRILKSLSPSPFSCATLEWTRHPPPSTWQFLATTDVLFSCKFAFTGMSYEWNHAICSLCPCLGNFGKVAITIVYTLYVSIDFISLW